MKKIYLLLFSLTTLALILFLVSTSKTTPQETGAPTKEISSQEMKVTNPPQDENLSENEEDIQKFSPPLSNSQNRITKKPFGFFVTPQNSPVSPERFSGYHTGVDFEVFLDELNQEIPVHAVCAGKLLMKKNAYGYGGVAVQSCAIENQPITVVYGHLNLDSISKNAGEILEKDQEIGVLGQAYSAETDGERKHLHLAFHKGSDITLLGYIQNKINLSDWLDPQLYIF